MEMARCILLRLQLECVDFEWDYMGCGPHPTSYIPGCRLSEPWTQVDGIFISVCEGNPVVRHD